MEQSKITVSLEQLQLEQIMARTLAERAGLIQSLHAQLTQEQQRNAQLEKRVQELEKQVGTKTGKKD